MCVGHWQCMRWGCCGQNGTKALQTWWRIWQAGIRSWTRIRRAPRHRLGAASSATPNRRRRTAKMCGNLRLWACKRLVLFQGLGVFQALLLGFRAVLLPLLYDPSLALRAHFSNIFRGFNRFFCHEWQFLE